MSVRKEIPAELWKRIESLIPQVKPSPKGERPHISDQQALNGIIYVLRTGLHGKTCLRSWATAAA